MKPVKKQNDLRLVHSLVSGLLPQKMTWFSSVLESGFGTKISVTLHGAASEKITLSDGRSVTTNTSGIATIEVVVGCVYSLTGSVSGYTREMQYVYKDTTDLYCMPVGTVLYWYGNLCADVTGGWSRAYSDSVSYFGFETTSKYMRVYSTAQNFKQHIATNKSVNLKRCSKITVVYASYRTSPPSGLGYYQNTGMAFIDTTNRNKEIMVSPDSNLAYYYLGNDTSDVKKIIGAVSVAQDIYVAIADNYVNAGVKIYAIYAEW